MAEMIAAEPPRTELKDWFVPCTRLQIGFFFGLPQDTHTLGTFPPGFRQVELIRADGFAETTWTWEELYSFTRNKIVWFGPTGYINGTSGVLESSGNYRPILNIEWTSFFDGEWEDSRDIAFWALSAAQGTAACDLCIQSLDCDDDCDIRFNGYMRSDFEDDGTGTTYAPLPVSGSVLAQFIARGDGYTILHLRNFHLEEEHCRAIVSEASDEDQIALYGCYPTDEGFGVLLQGFRDNCGPMRLSNCHLDYFLLADALHGNTSLQDLGPVGGNEEEVMSNEEMGALLRSCTENKGLVNLNLSSHPFDDATWDGMCQSLASHPKIEYLSLFDTLPAGEADATDGTILEARKTRRTQALVDMMRTNKVITSFDLDDNEHDMRLVNEKIKPCLKLNEYRPCIQHLKKVEVSQREPLLGRALHTHNDDSTLMYALLRGNTDIDWAARCRTRRTRKRVRYTK